MIATDIGNATAKVLSKVRANSESKVGSGRICSNDMRLAPSLRSRLFLRPRKVPQSASRLGLNG